MSNELKHPQWDVIAWRAAERAVELELVVSWLAEREREKKSEVEAAITFSTDKTVPKHSDIECSRPFGAGCVFFEVFKI